MNRLQKKCLIVTAGLHLTLILVLIFGTAFFKAKPKVDDTQVLDVIPANLIEAEFTSGVKSAQTPPPALSQPKPIVTPQPTPEPPKPAVTQPTFIDKMKEIFTPPVEKLPPDDMTPVEKPAKPKEHTIQPDLKLVVHKVQKNTDNSDAEADAKEQKRLRDEQRRAFKNALASIKANSSSATEINMQGNSSAAYANYGAAVVSTYHHAWIAPDNMASITAVITFSVTIARAGNVISSHIITSSGDASVDNAVQRMLDRVNFIGEFPDDSKDRQRTYSIDFNATRTSML